MPYQYQVILKLYRLQFSYWIQFIFINSATSTFHPIYIYIYMNKRFLHKCTINTLFSPRTYPIFGEVGKWNYIGTNSNRLKFIFLLFLYNWKHLKPVHFTVIVCGHNLKLKHHSGPKDFWSKSKLLTWHFWTINLTEG